MIVADTLCVKRISFIMRRNQYKNSNCQDLMPSRDVEVNGDQKSLGAPHCPIVIIPCSESATAVD